MKRKILKVKSSIVSTERIEIQSRRGIRTVMAYDQDSTMYLETGNACAGGNYPYVGCVAVHKTSSTDRTPEIPFGTRIQYEDNSANTQANREMAKQYGVQKVTISW